MHQIPNVGIRHARLQALERSFIDRHGGFARQPHEGDLMCALNHPAASGDRRRAHNLRLRSRFRDRIAEDESHGFFNPNRAGGNS